MTGDTFLLDCAARIKAVARSDLGLICGGGDGVSKIPVSQESMTWTLMPLSG